MDEFIKTRISGVEFEKEFFRLMRSDRDREPKTQQEQYEKEYELESILSRYLQCAMCIILTMKIVWSMNMTKKN